MNSPANPGQSTLRKTPCRYGMGCTHINDSTHNERFRHPEKQELSADEIRRSYMCNECGQGYDSLEELRFHLLKKTAWSNESLIGCRISCLVDGKEWHEGLVTHYHRSGKHCVEFRSVSEKRWFHMLKLAFYVIEPFDDHEKNEFKDNESGVTDVNSNTQQEWTYYEDISFDYAFTQSVLFKIYGAVIQETGHKTRGHLNLTENDRHIAKSQKGSLLYGELLPRGVNKALDPCHLDAAKAQTLFDMGMGTGKVAIQAFLQFRNLLYVYGIELSVGRYLVAEAAALHMVQLLGSESFHVDVIHGEEITITELVGSSGEENGRTLRLQCGNMMNVKNLNVADIIMMETDVPSGLQVVLCNMLLQEMRDGAKILSYHDLFKIWPLPSCPFKQLDVNCTLADRFPTSWSVQRGHHFYLFKRASRVSSRNPFQRHLQRTMGKGSSNYNGESSSRANKLPTLSNNSPRSANQLEQAANEQFSFGSSNNLEKEYRESQTYINSFPLQPNQTINLDAAAYQYDKEFPRLRRLHENPVIVDESSCGCGMFSFICCSFSKPKSDMESGGKSHLQNKSGSIDSPRMYDTLNYASSTPNISLQEAVKKPVSSNHAPTIKVISSNIPKNVVVEQNKNVPSKEKVKKCNEGDI